MQNKWERFEQFSSELEPLVKQLNGLLEKYQIYPIEGFISFMVLKHENKFTPFINYEAFPAASVPSK
jgi:hypothetical protein